MELAIEDNGVGFDPGGVVKLGHQGLANTRERTAQIGGTLTIVSRPGAGTRVFIRAPVEPREARTCLRVRLQRRRDS